MIKVQDAPIKKPEWLKIKLNISKNYSDMKNLMEKHSLNTVCEEARCPNIYECWNYRTATVMIFFFLQAIDNSIGNRISLQESNILTLLIFLSEFSIFKILKEVIIKKVAI